MLDSRVLPLIVAVVAVVAVTASGCSPYDPDLGASPFLCGDGEPRCPDGYVCVERVGSKQTCEREEAVEDAGGDGNLQCSGDATREPNETISNPTDVPIPSVGETFVLDATICPATDIDMYRLNVDTTGKNVRVEVNYEPIQMESALVVDLLNSTGLSIRTATPTNNDHGKLRADFTNLAQGTYFGRVQGAINNYSVTFIVTADVLPP